MRKNPKYCDQESFSPKNKNAAKGNMILPSVHRQLTTEVSFSLKAWYSGICTNNIITPKAR